MTSREADTFSKHNFGNVRSLLKVEINRWLINDLLARWHTVDQVFRFWTLDLCLTIKEYSRIPGDHYDTDFIVMPPLTQGFKIRMSRDLGIKKEIIGPRIERNECPLDFFPIWLPIQILTEKTNIFQDFSGRVESKSDTRFWTLFPKNPKGVDVKLLHSREQIEGGHTYVPALLADTIRVLCIATTFSTHLECCASLLQIWLLEHLVVCKPLITNF